MTCSLRTRLQQRSLPQHRQLNPFPETQKQNRLRQGKRRLRQRPQPILHLPRLIRSQKMSSAPLPASRQRSLFSLLQSPPGQRPFLNNRLSRTPDVFGDSFIPVSAKFNIPGATDFAKADLPLGGGMRRFKNEHARALPTDRVFFLYNHFHNALRLQTQNTSTTDNVDQFTFGFEKTSDDGAMVVRTANAIFGRR